MFLNDFAPLALSVQSVLCIYTLIQVNVPFLFLLLLHNSLPAYVYKIGTHGVINFD